MTRFRFAPRLAYAPRDTLRARGVGGAVGIVASVLIGLTLVSSCKPKGSVQASTPAQEVQAPQPVAEDALTVAPPAPSPAKALPQADTASSQQEDAGAGRITIAGGWVNAGGACDSGASVFFNTDGTYMSEGEKGTWALQGQTLTVTTSSTFEEGAPMSQGPDKSTGDSGERSVLTLLSVTDDAARVVLSNGSNANWTRCNS